MNWRDVEVFRAFVIFKEQRVGKEEMKEMLRIDDDEYKNFSDIINICSNSNVRIRNTVHQPSLFKNRKYVAEFLIDHPFEFKTTKEVSEASDVSESTVARAMRDYPDIKKLIINNDNKDLFIENVRFHKRSTRKAIALIKDSYFEKKEKITKEKLVDEVGFTPKACQSFLKRFPNYAVFVEDGF